jgi:hypothetical protein
MPKVRGRLLGAATTCNQSGATFSFCGTSKLEVTICDFKAKSQRELWQIEWLYPFKLRGNFSRQNLRHAGAIHIVFKGLLAPIRGALAVCRDYSQGIGLAPQPPFRLYRPFGLRMAAIRPI